jgi:hypothetical protein
VRTARSFIRKTVILVGNSLTLIGCAGLMLAATGLVDAESFAHGISSGVRVVGSVAIAGCRLSAIGYGSVDCLEK